MYADWLEDRGDSQAEYIRIECELAAGIGTLKALRNTLELRTRSADLWRLNRSQWDNRLFKVLNGTALEDPQTRAALIDWTYRRGCVEKIEMTSSSLREHLQSALLLGPVTYLRITKERKNECGFEIEHLKDVSALQQILHLDLSEVSKRKDLVKAIRNSEVQLSQLKTIRITSDRKPKYRYRSRYPNSPDSVHFGMARKIFKATAVELVEFQMVGKVEVIKREQVFGFN